MKLAEALILRANHQKRLEELKERLLRVVKVQEGDKPSEDPNVLTIEYLATVDDLTRLVKNINVTNSSTSLEPGKTIADAIAERDGLRLKHKLSRDAAEAASVKYERYSRSEVKFTSTIDVGAFQESADKYAQQYRELDAEIQALNWATDLREVS